MADTERAATVEQVAGAIVDMDLIGHVTGYLEARGATPVGITARTTPGNPQMDFVVELCCKVTEADDDGDK